MATIFKNKTSDVSDVEQNMVEHFHSKQEPQPATVDFEQKREPHAVHFDHSVWAVVHHNPLSSMWDLQGVSAKELLRRTWEGIDEEDLFGRASQLAYSFFSAIFPALIAVASLMGIIAQTSNDLYVRLLERIAPLIPASAYSLVVNTFRETTKASSTGKVTLGLFIALFSASFGISAIQDTLNTVYKVKENRSFWKARLQAIGLTILVAAIIVGVLGILFAGDYLSKHVGNYFRYSHSLAVLFEILAWVLASLLMILSFEVMYYFCPDVPHRRWRWFTPGGLICLVGWIAGSVGLRVYLHYFNSFSLTYGSLGTVAILLLWFYVTGVMILVGGEVNSEIEHAVAEQQLRSGACSLPPQSAIDRIDFR